MCVCSSVKERYGESLEVGGSSPSTRTNPYRGVLISLRSVCVAKSNHPDHHLNQVKKIYFLHSSTKFMSIEKKLNVLCW